MEKQITTIEYYHVLNLLGVNKFNARRGCVPFLAKASGVWVKVYCVSCKAQPLIRRHVTICQLESEVDMPHGSQFIGMIGEGKDDGNRRFVWIHPEDPNAKELRDV